MLSTSLSGFRSWWVSLLLTKPLLGALLLPGALVYTIYNYMAYVLGRPMDWIAVCGLVLVIDCFMALVFSIKAINHEVLKQRLEGNVGEAVSGWTLVLFGLLFLTLAISTIVVAVVNEKYPHGKIAVAVSDIVISVGLVGGGKLLLQKKPLGYSVAFGLLVATNSLFIGLVAFFFIAPFVSDRRFDWNEVASVLVMALFCFIPTGVFLWGVLDSSSVSESQLKIS